MELKARRAATDPYSLELAAGVSLDFETAPEVFVPTQTSRLLMEGARRLIGRPGSLLDVGCGVGVCGIALAKLGLCRCPIYLSDVSGSAARLAARNAQRHHVEAVVKQGDLLTPWAGRRFDVIVDDVSGVCEDIARLTSWFPAGVDCQSGQDGTALVVRVLTDAPGYLHPGGRIIFPVLSLSHRDRILEAARAVFTEVSLVLEQSWFLPEELVQHFEVVHGLLERGLISLEYKFGAWLWSTQIYQARGPRRAQSAEPSGEEDAH